MKLQAANFPTVLRVVNSRKKSTNELTRRQILNCVVTEISNNNEATQPNIVNYLIYEEDTEKIHSEILSNVKTYDESLEYVKSMIELLEATFEPAEISHVITGENIPAMVSNNIQEKPDDETAANEKPAEVSETDDKIPAAFQEAQYDRADDEEDSGVVDLQDKTEELQLVDRTAPEEDEHQEMAPLAAESQVQDDESIAEPVPNDKTVTAPSNDLISMDTFDATQEAIISESIEPASPDFSTTSSINLSVEISPIVLSDSDPEENFAMDTADEKTLSDQRYEALTSLYQERLKKIQGELDKRYEIYKNCPGLHPNIVNEWKKFYLEHSYNISQTRNCNYIPAWLNYWTQRLIEYKQKESQAQDMKLKQSLFNSPRRAKLRFSDLSDISDEEGELQTPTKRQKLDLNESESGQLSIEQEQLVNAYHLGYLHGQEGKRLTREELLQQLDAFCMSSGADVEQSNDLTDSDLLMIYKNIHSLSQLEQINFDTLMKNILLTDPIRYSSLQRAMDTFDTA